MGVYVDKEYRVKRKSSENGRKSAFAHKVKNGGKNHGSLAAANRGVAEYELSE